MTDRSQDEIRAELADAGKAQRTAQDRIYALGRELRAAKIRDATADAHPWAVRVVSRTVPIGWSNRATTQRGIVTLQTCTTRMRGHRPMVGEWYVRTRRP